MLSVCAYKVLGKHRDESQGHFTRVVKTDGNLPGGQRGGIAQVGRIKSAE